MSVLPLTELWLDAFSSRTPDNKSNLGHRIPWGLLMRSRDIYRDRTVYMVWHEVNVRQKQTIQWLPSESA